MTPWRLFSRLFDPERNDIRTVLGAGKHAVVDVSEGTVALNDADNASAMPKKGCRYFEVDVEGIIKFDYTDDNGFPCTRVMNALPGRNLYMNITRVYDTYNGSTPCAAQSYNDDGELITGIVLIY